MTDGTNHERADVSGLEHCISHMTRKSSKLDCFQPGYEANQSGVLCREEGRSYRGQDRNRKRLPLQRLHKAREDFATS